MKNGIIAYKNKECEGGAEVEREERRRNMIAKHIKKSDVEIFCFDCIPSTNLEAKSYAMLKKSGEKAAPALFVASEQSAGRGRLGRSFLSRRDKGIYMSLLYFTYEDLSDAVTITTAAAVVVASCLERASGERMMIKWVNDIYTKQGKVAGILTETVLTEIGQAVIVGIGINLGENDFPEDLKGIAASVPALDLERECELIARICEGLLVHSSDCQNRSYMEEYRQRMIFVGEETELLRGGERVGYGKVLGVDDDGGLLFLPQGEAKPIVVHTGEISVRLAKKQ